MTRTRDISSKASNNLQPTKLAPRRGGAGGDLPISTSEDLKHSHAPRIIYNPNPVNFNDNGKPSHGARKGAAKVSLGAVMFNLKPQHYCNVKSKLKPASLSDIFTRTKPQLVKTSDLIPSSEVDAVLCGNLKNLCISNEPESKRGEYDLQQALKTLVAQKARYEAGQEITVLTFSSDKPKTFKKSGSAVRKAGVRNWKSPEGSDEIHSGLLRNLFSWSLSTSTRWKEVEERVTGWGSVNKHIPEASLEKTAEQLNISVEEMKQLHFHKDLRRVFDVLKNHICHTNLPWISTMAALMELQKGNITAATSDSTHCHGSFLHSEIIDKHICYISRNEDTVSSNGLRSSFSTKAELFRKQIQDTISFGEDINCREESNALSNVVSTFDPKWNIVQITALLQPKNRFGMDLYARRQVPQLILSAIAHVPGVNFRSTFTTFCPAPQVYESSLMRFGLMDEFQKILDRNLVISDDSIVISRRNYWEERRKHNEAMKAVIQAMEEEWIGPWNFLLPGHTIHKEIQNKILSKVVNPSAKKYKLSPAQKLVLYKITENYKCMHTSVSAALETVVSFILKAPETSVGSLCKSIREIGCEVPQADRHPTILVVDQDLEIYPWESMNCLTYTDVTRMPSLNLIRSNYNFVSSLCPSFPDIIDSNSCTFILNPDGTLPNVQNRLEKYLSDHKEWVPVIGRPPATQEVQECLENQHIFLYNGHGAGSNFYPDYAVQKLVCRAVPLLMGCASAQAHYAMPRVYGSSTIHSYFLAGCPSVVGYLWEVTDGECDRITVDLIERWLPHPDVRPPSIVLFDPYAQRDKERCLPTAMRISRKAATQLLTQCAIVCYGLPINTQTQT